MGAFLRSVKALTAVRNAPRVETGLKMYDFLPLSKDGRLNAYLLQYGFHHGTALLSCGFQTKPRFTRRHSSSWQNQPKRIGAATAVSAGGLRVPAEAGLILTGRRGAGVQPGSFTCDGAPVFETGLVQDPAPQADYPRGGLRQPHHHQPLLLRTVQLLLHPAAHPQGGGCLPVLFVLQAEAFYHHDFYFELPGPSATHQEEAHPARQTVPMHIHRPGLKKCVCVCVSHSYSSRTKLSHRQEHVPVSIWRNRPERPLTCWLHRVPSCTTREQILASYKPTMNCKQHFALHQLAKFENRHHCTGTLTWHGHVFTHGFLPRRGLHNSVYLILQDAYCDGNTFLSHLVFVCASCCMLVGLDVSTVWTLGG